MIFVDTWAWIALADRRDPYHAVATQQHARFQQASRPYLTTDFVLSELITYLYDALPAQQAQGFVRAIITAGERGPHEIVHVSAVQFQQAWEMRQKYDDKPDISFVDFTSFVVMRERGIVEVFTGDKHFEHVGLGFRLAPARMS